MELETLRDLFIDELKDIYSAEKQLTKALPKMVKAASSEELKEAFTSHLEETKGHVDRLEQIFELLESSPRGKTCKGMEGLIAEGAEMIAEDATDEVKDAALISAGNRVEHYEIAAYGTVRTYAELLGLDDAVRLLEETLHEEKAADQKLTAIAQDINVEAMGEDSEEAESEEAA